MQIEILDVNVVMCVDRLALVIIVDYLNERKKISESSNPAERFFHFSFIHV